MKVIIFYIMYHISLLYPCWENYMIRWENKVHEVYMIPSYAYI